MHSLDLEKTSLYSEEIDNLTPEGGVFIIDFNQFLFHRYTSDHPNEEPQTISGYVNRITIFLQEVLAKKNSGIGYIKIAEISMEAGEILKPRYFTAKGVGAIIDAKTATEFLKSFSAKVPRSNYIEDDDFIWARESLKMITE